MNKKLNVPTILRIQGFFRTKWNEYFNSEVNNSKRAFYVWFSDYKMNVQLEDGREIAVPIEWFSILREHTEKETTGTSLEKEKKFIGRTWMR